MARKRVIHKDVMANRGLTGRRRKRHPASSPGELLHLEVEWRRRPRKGRRSRGFKGKIEKSVAPLRPRAETVLRALMVW